MQNGSHRRLLSCTLTFAILALVFARPCTAQQGEGAQLLRALPLAFEPNRGQTEQTYQFVSHAGGLVARFEPNAAEFTVPGLHSPQTIRLQFLGAAPEAEVIAEQPLRGKVSYLRGADPSRWIGQIPTFGRIRYRSLYPGIDLLFYGNGEHVEHDFVVAPTSDPDAISIEVAAAGKIQLGDNGDLLIRTEDAVLRFQKPAAYQTTPTGKKFIPVEFRITGSTFSFKLGRFDAGLPLVIDPILSYSTFLAGSQRDVIAGLALDAAGNEYVTGATNSTDFPTKSPYQATCNASGFFPCADVFVTKLDPTGSALIYSTYIGGSNGDYSTGIAVDAQGNAVVAGYTGSIDFPTKNSYATFGNFNTTYAFVLALSPDGALNYSTLLGQVQGLNQNIAITADSSGCAYVAGQTYDLMFPVTAGTVGNVILGYPHLSTFVTKLATNGAIKYSTIIPGTFPQIPYTFSGNDFNPMSIATDQISAVYIGGRSGPGLPTTPGVLAANFPGQLTGQPGYFGFALKLSPDASTITYATYLPLTDSVTAVAPNSSGMLYVAGLTYSTTFPATVGVFQTQCLAGVNTPCVAGFAAKLDATASKYAAATYLSGTPAPSNAGTRLQSISVEAAGNLWIGGVTGSADFPLKNPLVSSFPAFQDGGFITELSGDLTTLIFSTFLNGQTNPFNHTLQVYVASRGPGIVVAAGSTGDPDFPTTPGSFQPVLPNAQMFGAPHGFVAMLDTTVPAPAVCLSATSLNFGSWLINTASPAQQVTVQNCGNSPLHVQAASSSAPEFSEVNTCSGPVAPGSSCKISVIFTPSSLNFFSATLTLQDDAAITTQTISIYGQGGQPQLQLPLQLPFGDLLVGTSASIGFALLQNTGNGNLIVSNIKITGDYSFQSFCAKPVSPNEVCLIIVTFAPKAPGSRMGLLTITDNAPGSPQTIQLIGNGISIYPTPTIAAMLAVPVASQGGFLQINGNYFFPASVVLWHGSPRPIYFLDENNIWATLTAEDLTQIGQVDVRVVNPLPGGGTSAAANATVYLSLPQSTADIQYDKHSRRLYASVPASAASNANSVMVLDPDTGSLLRIIPTGNNPRRLALSEDGKLLYVSLDETGQILRISTETWKVQQTIQLPADIFFRQKVAQDMAVIPGLPKSIVVALAYTTASPQSAGVIVYDDAIPRPNSIPDWSNFPNIAANSISFLGSDTSTVYGSDLEVGTSFYRFNLDANGITVKDVTSTYGGGVLTTDGILFYEGAGNIIDPKVPSVVRTYTPSDGGVWSAVQPDVKRNNVYATEDTFNPLFFSRTLFTKADLKTFVLRESIVFPGFSNPPQAIVPFSGQGIALRLGIPSYLRQVPDSRDALFIVNDGPAKAGEVDISAANAGVAIEPGTGNYLVRIALRNDGNLPAKSVQVKRATITAASGGAAVGTVTKLPLTTALGPGATTQITLSFPASSGSAGTHMVLKLAEEPYTFLLPGGTVGTDVWSASVRTVLP